MIKQKLLQESLNSIEIEGLQAMFNEFYMDYLIQQMQTNEQDYEPHEFFYCDGRLWSSDKTNGEPIFFEGYEISELAKREGGDLTYMVLGDQDQEQYLCEFNKYNGQWYILETEASGKTF